MDSPQFWLSPSAFELPWTPPLPPPTPFSVHFFQSNFSAVTSEFKSFFLGSMALNSRKKKEKKEREMEKIRLFVILEVLRLAEVLSFISEGTVELFVGIL